MTEVAARHSFHVKAVGKCEIVELLLIRTEIEQWGIPLPEVDQLGERLFQFYGRFRSYTQTKTRDTSEYGLGYLSGLLRMETKRNLANVGRKTAMPGQNLQHFISNSPCVTDHPIMYRWHSNDVPGIFINDGLILTPGDRCAAVRYWWASTWRCVVMGSLKTIKPEMKPGSSPIKWGGTMMTLPISIDPILAPHNPPTDGCIWRRGPSAA